MKKVFILLVCFLVVFLSACKPKQTEEVSLFEEIYNLGVESQAIDVTYEEWLASIKGEDGSAGIDGREVSLQVDSGYILNCFYKI